MKSREDKNHFDAFSESKRKIKKPSKKDGLLSARRDERGMGVSISQKLSKVRPISQKKLNSHVIDLRRYRDSNKSRSRVIVSDTNLYFEHGAKASTKYLDSSFDLNISSNEHVIKRLSDLQNSFQENSFTNSKYEYSKEELFEELSFLDKEDLKIQSMFSYKPKLASSLMSEEDEVSSLGTSKDIQLIPRPLDKNFKNKKRRKTKVSRRAHRRSALRDKDSSAKSLFKIKKELPKFQKGIDEILGISKKQKKKNKITALFMVLFLFFGVIGFFVYNQALLIRVDAQVSARVAYKYMELGKEALFNLDALEAKNYFLKAQEEFSNIENMVNFFGKDLVLLAAQFPIQTSVTSTAHLIRAGNLFAQAGQEVSMALSLFQEAYSESNENSKKYLISVDERTAREIPASRVGLTDKIIEASFNLQKAKNYLDNAGLELSRVRPQDITEEFKNDIFLIQSQTNQAEILFEKMLSMLDIFLEFFGHSQSKQYLLVFQNSSELRATGGFIGTYGILKLDKGNIASLFIEGIYYPDGQLAVNVIPPEPLKYITPNLGTRDANWFFDFPTSAEKLIWFYKNTGGAEVDGVITFTPEVIKKMLDLTGPIDMPDYGVILDSGNFLELVQKEVEQDYDKKLNRPKQILSDLVPLLFEKLSKVEKVKLFNVVIESLEMKDVLIYSRDTKVQNFLASKNWHGAIYRETPTDDTLFDYLAVVISNIGGWKTDLYTNTEIDTVTLINDVGEILRTVIISRKHNGGFTPYKWYNKPNYAYIRIYTPEGSELISAEGFSDKPSYVEVDYQKEGYIEDKLIASIESTMRKDEISNTDIFEESNKTVFANWLKVNPQERGVVKITYKLPSKITPSINSYNLTIQKQGGLSAYYSGYIEELNGMLSIKFCKDEDSIYQNNQFKFVQTSDKTIICNL